MALSWIDAAPIRRHQGVIAVVAVVEALRLMAQDAAAFARRWHGFVAFIRDAVAREGGRLHRSLGDGLVLEFADAGGCIRCARAMHAWFAEGTEGLPAPERVPLRIGAHLAQFLADGHDIYGTDVALAMRMAALPGAGETVVSHALRERLPAPWNQAAEDLGPCPVQPLRQTVRAYRIGPGAAAAPCVREPFQPLQPTVAVLPPEDGDPAAGPMAHALVEALAAQGDVQVLSLLQGDALQPRPDAAGLRFARALGARYLLRLRPAGAPGTLLWRLVDTTGGQRLWLHRVPPGQPRAAVRLANGVASAVLRHEAQRTPGRPPAALDASALRAGGIMLLHALRPAEHERACTLLEQLAERHADLPAAHAWLAHGHVLRVQQGWSSDVAADAGQALQHTRRALEAESRSALALATQGWVQMQLAQAPSPALARCMEAVDAVPGWALGWTWLGLAYALHGETERARAALQRGGETPLLDVLHPLRDAGAASGLVLAGRWTEAARMARSALRGNSQCIVAWEALVQAQWRLGRRLTARASAVQLLRRAPDYRCSRFLDRTPATGALAAPLVAALRDAGLPP